MQMQVEAAKKRQINSNLAKVWYQTKQIIYLHFKKKLKFDSSGINISAALRRSLTSVTSGANLSCSWKRTRPTCWPTITRRRSLRSVWVKCRHWLAPSRNSPPATFASTQQQAKYTRENTSKISYPFPTFSTWTWNRFFV